MHKAFRYRCYPTRLQEGAMEAMLETHRRLYNRALAERKDAWEGGQRTVRYGEQSGHLKDDRKTNPSLAKTMTFRQEADGWYVVFSCDLGDAVPASAPGPSVGIDLGLKAFLVTSQGIQVAPPKFYRKAQARLRRTARRVARRKKGSNRRRKAVRQLAKAHQHIANQRKDFHHKTALHLVRRHGLIAHEDLNVRGIARTGLAKSTHDAGWAGFLAILAHKAEEAGVTVIGVNPRHTTQACSGCGTLPETRLTLADRVHVCSRGLTLDRDENAARNILQRALGLSVRAVPPPLGDGAREAVCFS